MKNMKRQKTILIILHRYLLYSRHAKLQIITIPKSRILYQSRYMTFNFFKFRDHKSYFTTAEPQVHPEPMAVKTKVSPCFTSPSLIASWSATGIDALARLANLCTTVFTLPIGTPRL